MMLVTLKGRCCYLLTMSSIDCHLSVVRQYAAYILMNLRLIETNRMDPDQTAPYLGTQSLFAIKTTRVHHKMRKQTTIVENGRESIKNLSEHTLPYREQ